MISGPYSFVRKFQNPEYSIKGIPVSGKKFQHLEFLYSSENQRNVNLFLSCNSSLLPPSNR